MECDTHSPADVGGEDAEFGLGVDVGTEDVALCTVDGVAGGPAPGRY